MTPGWDMKMERISSWGSIQRGNKRYDNSRCKYEIGFQTQIEKKKTARAMMIPGWRAESEQRDLDWPQWDCQPLACFPHAGIVEQSHSYQTEQSFSYWIWKALISGGEAASACYLKIIYVAWLWSGSTSSLTDWPCPLAKVTICVWLLTFWLKSFAPIPHTLCDQLELLSWPLKHCTLLINVKSCIESCWAVAPYTFPVSRSGITLAACDVHTVHINNYIWNCFRGHGPGRQEDGLIS